MSFLAAFDFQISYRSGAEGWTVDSLSKPVEDAEYLTTVKEEDDLQQKERCSSRIELPSDEEQKLCRAIWAKARLFSVHGADSLRCQIKRPSIRPTSTEKSRDSGTIT